MDFHPFVTPENRAKIKLPNFDCEVFERIDVEKLNKIKITKPKPKPITTVTKTEYIDTIKDLYSFYRRNVPSVVKSTEFKKILKDPKAFGGTDQFDLKK